MAEATKTKFDAKKETGELTISRVFNAPRDKVFKAWTSAEAIKQWWGPRTWPTVYCELDFNEGGKWHYAMQGPDGTKAWGLAIYKEIDEPSRIVYTDAFSDEDGNINHDLPVTTIEMTFEELPGGKTRIVSHAKYTPEELQKVTAMGMEEGLAETWDRLEEYLAK
ncbi:MAG: hypothetical protein K0S68_994 [Candidatus Saccharibacteria bacterium]|jgi:uncharacterized protein YndB with AHSA1/START domain|nr:hypothetical protein [Candidatus Saccharibacteria bacterium]